MSTNLKGPFFLTQRVAKAMLTAPAPGRAARLHRKYCSISAYTSSINRAEYCVSKAGLAMMTALFADRLADSGINVYEIRPGIIDTDMTSVAKTKYDKLIGEGLTPSGAGHARRRGARVLAIAEGLLPVIYRRGDQRGWRLSPAQTLTVLTEDHELPKSSSFKTTAAFRAICGTSTSTWSWTMPSFPPQTHACPNATAPIANRQSHRHRQPLRHPADGRLDGTPDGKPTTSPGGAGSASARAAPS